MKAGNCEVTPQALWPTAKSLMKTDTPKVRTAIHGSLGITYHQDEKDNDITDCLENHFTPHDLCDQNHERVVETRVQVLLASVEDTPLRKSRPCDLHKLANLLKLRKACELDGIPNKYLMHLPSKPFVLPTQLCNHCLLLSQFPKPWNEAKFIKLPKPRKKPKFPQI
jgi:hypothetical protein